MTPITRPFKKPRTAAQTLGVYKSQSEGAAFESLIRITARMHHCGLVQIPTGAKTVGMFNGRPKFIPIKTPFDFVLGKDGMSVFFDAKSTADNAFKFSKINQNQLSELLTLDRVGMRAGYLVYFRTHGKIRFFSANVLAAVKSRGSLKPEDGEDVGSFENFKMDALLKGDGSE